ncbi:hypothetical protein LCGC14_3011410, partial [marine sediment metagenome]
MAGLLAASRCLTFAIVGVALLASSSPAYEPPLDEWRVKREAVFEFARKPHVSRNGDRITIQFATKGFCDVSVAVEDAKGKIVRHLASGVLGDNAPPPLRKDSLAQSLVWDGKDDSGRYVEDVSPLTVRVSLGLKPRYEQSLNEAPMKLPSFRSPPGKVFATAEGVYYFTFGSGVSFLRLLDHDGRYVRTIYPFPAAKLPQVRGAIRREFPRINAEDAAGFVADAYGVPRGAAGAVDVEGRPRAEAEPEAEAEAAGRPGARDPRARAEVSSRLARLEARADRTIRGLAEPEAVAGDVSLEILQESADAIITQAASLGENALVDR